MTTRPGLKEPTTKTPQPQITRLLTVDPSIQSGHCGWCAWKRGHGANQWIAHTAGTIRFPKDTPKDDSRLDILERNAHELIQAYDPHRIVIEDQFVDRDGKFDKVSPRAILKLKESMMCWRFLGVPVTKVDGETWQKHCGIKSNMSKQQRKIYIASIIYGRIQEYARASDLMLVTEHERAAFLIGCWWIETGADERG